MRWIQKVVVNGSSAQVTVPRALMKRLKLRPGRFVEIVHRDDSATFTVREWADRVSDSRQSPGLVADLPEVPR